MDKKKYVFKNLVIDSRTGLNPRKNFKLGHGDNYYITIKDIHDGDVVITDKTERIDNEALKIINKRSRLKVGDVLFSSIGRIGETAIIKEEPKNWNINESVFAFTVNDQLITPEFFRWMFKAPKNANELKRESTGSTFVSIKMNKLNEMEYEIPSLADQKSIVYELETLSVLINNCDQRLARFDELINSKFNEMFSNKNLPAECLIKLSTEKGQYGAASASTEFDSNRPRYVRITDINDDGTLNDDCVSSANPKDDEDYKLQYGDFLFARMGATVGKTYAHISGNEIYAGYLIKYRLDLTKLNPRYLFWFTKQASYWDWVSLAQSGAAQPGINAKKYDGLEVPLASIDLQNEFATFVEQVEHLKFIVKRERRNLEEILNSKIDYYFGI